MHKDKRKRSIVKAITYRLVSILMDGAIAYFITRNANQTIALVLVSNTISIMMYFIHERAWNRIAWGKRKIC